MTDQALPNFDEAQTDRDLPTPRKPRPRPQRKRPAKKAKRAAPPKPAKRVPKKRRVRKTLSTAKNVVVELPMTPSEAQAGWDVLCILSKQPHSAAIRIIDEVKAFYK